MALCHSVSSNVQFEFNPFSLSYLSCLYCLVIPKSELRLSLFPFSILNAFIYCLALLITHSQLHSFDCIMLPGLRITDEQAWKLLQLPKKNNKGRTFLSLYFNCNNTWTAPLKYFGDSKCNRAATLQWLLMVILITGRSCLLLFLSSFRTWLPWSIMLDCTAWKIHN